MALSGGKLARSVVAESVFGDLRKTPRPKRWQ